MTKYTFSPQIGPELLAVVRGNRIILEQVGVIMKLLTWKDLLIRSFLMSWK